MGKNLVFVPECPSTNSLALEISQQSPVKDGTVVITDHQTAGKGQRGNTWEAEPHQNLTFSVILRPGFLAIHRQFFLNIAFCLALKDYLKEKTSDAVYIKWPNDILVHEKKISGILIENQLQGQTISNSVAGIGFNLNQTKFTAPAATSLALVTEKQYDRGSELSHILACVEGRYLQLRQACQAGTMDAYQVLMGPYLEALYRRHQKRPFSSGGRIFEGVIRGLDEWGKLQVETSDGFRTFGAKEIIYLE